MSPLDFRSLVHKSHCLYWCWWWVDITGAMVLAQPSLCAQLFVHTYVLVHLFVHVHVCAGTCVCSYVEAGGQSWVSFLRPYCLSIAWRCQSQESECLYSSVLAWENEPPHLALFMQVLMFEHGSSFLEGKHFADWNPPCSLSLLVHGPVVAAPENLFSLLIQRHVACSSLSHLASCQLI